MNVAIKNSPFHREVREWQRVDPNTGALMSGRLQADRWNNGAANKYGKVIDSQHISTPNGTRLQQRKEMEILQARTVSGSIQVVRSSTVQKSSSRTTMNMSNALRASPIFAIEEVQSTLGHSDEQQRGSSPIITSPGGSPIIGYDRARSASTEDLASSIGPSDNLSDDDEDPRQWRRVSTIRRSLQYPKTTAPRYSSRPTDLPLNLVSVSKIKRDLESNSPSSPYATRKLDFEDNLKEKKVTVTEIENLETKQSVKRATLITTDSLAGIRDRLKRLSDESLYKEDMVVTPENPDTSISNTLESKIVLPSTTKPDQKLKLRDTNPADWYLRRKSYGFEEMPVQQQKSMSRMETSTDSGLGRSGEITSAWPTQASPTEEPKAKPRGTIITLSGILDDPNAHSPSRVLINASSPKPYYRSVAYRPTSSSSADPKRHSIAVDESKYVRDSKTLVNLNGVNNEWNLHLPNNLDDANKRSRRVEFCKTEVHFAAESGRVNIVETDGKPPSTNNFRRRRRSSTTFGESTVGSAGTVLMHFGDASTRKSVGNGSHSSIAEHIEARVTVVESTQFGNSLTETHLSKDDDESVDEISLRGILKNKPVKPTPYHLGENLESTERLWGVRLKPISGADDAEPNKEISLGYHDRQTEFTDKERGENADAQRNTGYATRVNLHQYSKSGSRPWANNDAINQSIHHHNHTSDSTSAAPSTVRTDDLSTQQNSAADKPIPTITKKDSFKSTSLIMQTIKSNTQPSTEVSLSLQTNLFDSNADPPSVSEDINRGSESMVMASTFGTTTTRCSSLAKTSSTSSVHSEGSVYKISNMVSNSSSSSSLSNSANSVSIYPISDSPRVAVSTANGKPIAAPRIKKIGTTSTTAGLSHQLSQLRRIYEAAELDSLENELVDNEVQLYLGGGIDTLKAAEAKLNTDLSSTELSGSWGRVRAQKNAASSVTVDCSKGIDRPTSLNISIEPQNTNRLSIMLHSPTDSTKSFDHHPTAKPVAKPRTTIESLQPRCSPQSAIASHLGTESMSPRPQARPDLKPANGARKLREHELSYFGLNVATSVAQSQNDATTVTNSKHPTKKTNHHQRSFSRTAEEGKLCSDKPDLLMNHTPETMGSSLRSFVRDRHRRISADSESSDTPIYENVQPGMGKPSKAYDRITDRQRDEENLRELNNGVLEIISTIKTGPDEPSRRSRSRSTQPFDTIREEGGPIVHQPKTMLSKGVQVSRGYNHTLHRIKPLHRTSSASSTESITSVGRSRRSSAEKVPTTSRTATRSHRVHSSDEGDSSVPHTVRPSRSSSKTTTQIIEKPQRSSSSSTKRPSETKDVKKSRKTSATGNHSSANSTKERVKASASVAESPRSHRKPHHVVVVREANMPLVTASSVSGSTSKKPSSSSQNRSHRDRHH